MGCDMSNENEDQGAANLGADDAGPIGLLTITDEIFKYLRQPSPHVREPKAAQLLQQAVEVIGYWRARWRARALELGRELADTQRRLGECSGGYETLSRQLAARQQEVEALRAQVATARDIVNLGVSLMTVDQVGAWAGVRSFLEQPTEDYSPQHEVLAENLERKCKEVETLRNDLEYAKAGILAADGAKKALARARQDALEEAAKVCARIRHNNNLIWRGTTIADPDHKMAKYRSEGADACEYAIRALQQHTGEFPDNG